LKVDCIDRLKNKMLTREDECFTTYI